MSKEQPEWYQVSERICSFCHPDTAKTDNFKQLHDSCFRDYVWLMEYRLSYALRVGILWDLLFPSE